MGCTAFADHWFFINFFIGVWDGLIAVISLILSLFWDVCVYDVCQQSWFYNLGFIGGVFFGAIIGFNSISLLIWLFVVLLVIKVIILILVPVAWGLAVGVGISIGVLVVFAALNMKKGNSYTFWPPSN